MKLDKTYTILIVAGIILAVSLAFKSLKQFVYLTFTLLTLKVVWVALALIIFALIVRKKLRSMRVVKK
jgi:prolipoprotein diacylglyceryltransferase